MTGFEIALVLIRHFEGCKLQAYVFPGETWATIGWGHAIPMEELDRTITQQEADDLLYSDLSARAKDLYVQLQSEYAKLSAGELGAALSFKYNCKPELFDSSTFLSLLQQGFSDKAQGEFSRWIYGETKVPLPGLVRRRRCEEFIFSGGTIEELIEENWFSQEASAPKSADQNAGYFGDQKLRL